MMTDEEQRELEFNQAVEKLRAEPIPEPTGGGTWKNDFDYVDFDYRHLDYIEIDKDIRKHYRFEQKKGWLYHFCWDRQGHRYVQFLNPDESGFHCQTILYRMDWMKNAKFIRSKPMNVKANSSNDARASPQLI